MKIYKYLGLSLMTLVLAGCQNEDIVSEQLDGLFTLKANMQGYSNDSRAQIELGNQNESAEYFRWNAGDKFTLIENVETEDGSTRPVTHEFTISDSYSGNPQSSYADFTSPTALKDHSTFTAFYPVVHEDEYGYNFYINNTLPDNSEESWISYFNKNMFMKTEGTYLTSEQTQLSFQQMCSLIRITYTNSTSTNRKIKKISVDGSWGSGFHVDKNSLECGASSGYGGDYGVEFTNGATIAAGESEDFYILYYPYQQYNSVTNQDELSLMKTIFVKLENNSTLSTEEYPFNENNRPDFFNGSGIRYWFKVTETADGLKWTNRMDEEPDGDEPEEDDTVYPEVPTGSILIKDKGFSEALYETLGETNVTLTDGYAIIKKQYANDYSYYLNFWDVELSNPIRSLEGIEYFKNLTELSVPESEVTSCDLSQNTQLRNVSIAYPQNMSRKLTSITLGNNTNLENLDVTGNNLTSLDLSGLPNLRELYCSENSNLSTITFSANCYIQLLSVNNTALSSLALANWGALKQLEISNTGIVPDWNQIGTLERLDCAHRTSDFIESIPDKIKENLTEFDCRDSNLTSLNMFPFKSLKTLRCSNNQLTNLDLSHLTGLRSLDCDHNRLTYLDLSATDSLEDLTCGYQQNSGGEYIVLKLLLSSLMQERWNSAWTNENGSERDAWKDGWSHKNDLGIALVELDTTGNSNGNSVGGSDFTYGESNIW